MDSPKRKIEDIKGNDQVVKRTKKEECPHGVKCYRRNPIHFREYGHEHLMQFINKDPTKFPDNFTQDPKVYKDQLEVMRVLLKPIIASGSANKKMSVVSSVSTSQNKLVLKPIKTMKDKLELAEPYNIFYTKVPKAVQTLNAQNAISFPDLLCPSLGVLNCSMQINFMIDIQWLLQQYKVHSLEKKPLTVIYGYEFPQMEDFMKLYCKNVKYHRVQMKDPFGTHHSKIGLYLFEHGSLRVVVSTANLYYEDWNHYNQGLWVSPPCPKLRDDQPDYACCGPTNFKTSLLNYLKSYKLPIMEEWIAIVKRADFSKVKVFLTTSVPGKHYPKDMGCHLHYVGALLSKHSEFPKNPTNDNEKAINWKVIAQASSIGSLGKNAGEWLRSSLLRSLASHKDVPLVSNSQAKLKLIFPSANNVVNSHFGLEGGGCLPYAQKVHDKQKWLNEYLHTWKSDQLGRSGAMPHIKSYCRINEDNSLMTYFLLTSANISKSAWGGNIQKDSSSYVRSYEAGVLFLPKMFDKQYFKIGGNRVCDNPDHIFPLIFDLPLQHYSTKDEPWAN
ncbi:PREDICTED: probable tyrosyl-DNA phosphodiesterase [Nicrophorus vespilloides]|uniref:Probable tyrosyl-DNA phosphodiesterase n=1 Tax=Nicrophorus vespilloides TaxID=110193 RepID=A0ABM1MMS1_NICVS|nr:PREDICTED: probable tyrosyl-DNA phosphodiesterase [Nicrophorus vespilloides]